MATTGLPRERRGWPIDARILLVVGAFLAAGAVIFPAAGWDDSYITFWSAYSLSDLHRLANYNHDLVEQSTTLGFVLVIALIRWITRIDAALIGRLASIAFGAGTLVATGRLADRLGSSAARIAVVLLASATYFLYWSFGGMETTVDACAGIVLISLITRALDDGLAARRVVAIAAALVMYLLVRPESVFVLAATLVGLAALEFLRRMRSIDRRPWESRVPRVLLVVVALVAVTAGAITAWRLWYFGLLFPQPVYAKATGFTVQKMNEGFRYLTANGANDFGVVLTVAAVAAAGLFVSRKSGAFTTPVEPLCAMFCMAHFGFVVLSGGDGMHGGRVLVPAMPELMILCGAWLSRSLSPLRMRLAVAAWVALQLAGVVAFARTQSHSDPIWAVADAGTPADRQRFSWFERADHDHRRYFTAVTELEKHVDRIAARKKPVSILSGQSGFVMYHLGLSRPNTFRYVDRFGLSTRDFVDCRVSEHAARTTWGLFIPIEDYLRRRRDFQQQCGIAPPDIIYEIFGPTFPPELRSLLTDAGYDIVYEQDHLDLGGSALFPGRMVARVYIATLTSSGPADGK